MSKQSKTLKEHLDECKDDEHVTKLWSRYYQHLEIGPSHWRESVIEDMKADGKSVDEIMDRMMNTKNSKIEAEFLKKHPGIDANQLRLQMKYGSRSM